MHLCSICEHDTYLTILRDLYIIIKERGDDDLMKLFKGIKINEKDQETRNKES